MKQKLIMESAYEIRVVRECGEKHSFFRRFKYLSSVSYSLRLTDVRTLTPHLESIAKREKLDLAKFTHFEMALDILKYQISWN